MACTVSAEIGMFESRKEAAEFRAKLLEAIRDIPDIGERAMVLLINEHDDQPKYVN